MKQEKQKWRVSVSAKAERRLRKLPSNILDRLSYLIKDIEDHGPVRGNWANYGKLSTGGHHCHLKKGNPTYVAVWRIVKDEIQLVEVTYVGTHEKAPY